MAPSRRRRSTVLLLFVLCACSEQVVPADKEDTLSVADIDENTLPEDSVQLPPLPGSLADNLKWSPVDKSNDPFWKEENNEDDICPPTQWETETEHDGVWFTIETNICGYLTVSQPLIRSIDKGEEVRIRIWYFTITIGEGEALFHIAIGADSEPVWSSSLEIPTEKGGLIMETWTAPRDYAIGETIYFNISNHGSNSWSLIELASLSESTP